MKPDSLFSLHVGVRVSGHVLDVCTSTGDAWRCQNDTSGIASLVRRLRDHSVACIVLAASAGDTGSVAAALNAAQLPVTTPTPRQLLHFTKPKGGAMRQAAVFNAATLMRMARSMSPTDRGPLIRTY